MSSPPYKTALIGLGKIGTQYAADPQIAQYYKYSTHAQAIHDHPDFECGAMFDANQSISEQNYSSLEDIAENYKPDVLVLATPPQDRINILKKFNTLRAVVVEKPLAMSLPEATELVRHCEDNNITMQVNYWRRFDDAIANIIQSCQSNNEVPQTIFVTYGNGLRNNGVHIIDQVRFMFGEVESAVALCAPNNHGEFPIKGDCNIDFQLHLKNGAKVYASALDFSQYREIALDIWTDQRRIEFLQGGLLIRISSKENHRALKDACEIAHDCSQISSTGAGEAFYRLYDNLSAALQKGADPISNGRSALKNEEILEQLLA